jgi:hypothetical protein
LLDAGRPVTAVLHSSENDADCDLPLNFHPAAIRASAVFITPLGAVGATGGNA